MIFDMGKNLHKYKVKIDSLVLPVLSPEFQNLLGISKHLTGHSKTMTCTEASMVTGPQIMVLLMDNAIEMLTPQLSDEERRNMQRCEEHALESLRPYLRRSLDDNGWRW